MLFDVFWHHKLSTSGAVRVPPFDGGHCVDHGSPVDCCIVAWCNHIFWHVHLHDHHFSSACLPCFGSFGPNSFLLALNPPHGNNYSWPCCRASRQYFIWPCGRTFQQFSIIMICLVVAPHAVLLIWPCSCYHFLLALQAVTPLLGHARSIIFSLVLWPHIMVYYLLASRAISPSTLACEHYHFLLGLLFGLAAAIIFFYPCKRYHLLFSLASAIIFYMASWPCLTGY